MIAALVALEKHEPLGFGIRVRALRIGWGGGNVRCAGRLRVHETQRHAQGVRGPDTKSATARVEERRAQRLVDHARLPGVTIPRSLRAWRVVRGKRRRRAAEP